MRAQLVEGRMSWGGLKDLLFETLDQSLAEPRLRYRQLINHHEKIDYLLQAGAEKARPRAQEVIRRVRPPSESMLYLLIVQLAFHLGAWFTRLVLPASEHRSTVKTIRPHLTELSRQNRAYCPPLLLG